MPRVVHSAEYSQLWAAQPEHRDPGLNVNVPQLNDMAKHSCESDRTIKGMLLERARMVCSRRSSWKALIRRRWSRSALMTTNPS